MMQPEIAGEYRRAELMAEAKNERTARAALCASGRRGFRFKRQLTRVSCLALTLAVGAGIACGLGMHQADVGPPPTVAVDTQLTLSLAPAPSGGRAYTAVVSAADEGRTRVELRVDQIVRDEHTPAGEFGAFVARGTCEAFDSTSALQLTVVREGYSLTELPVGLAELTSSRHIIAVERSGDDTRGGVLACGAISSAPRAT
jgi:hypothetical protein